MTESSTIQVSDREFKSYLSREQIQSEVQRVASQINADLQGVERPLFLCVLNGAFIFAADLFRCITLPQAEFTTIRLKSYAGLSTTGEVRVISGLTEAIEGRTVVIIEDIVDSGYTMDRLIHQLLGFGAGQVKVCTLLRKPNALKVPNLQIDYCCFEIPNDFIVGYGLDYNEQGRNLPDIWVVK
ncbi:MAG: hypoxanthine phosphoribosyltransferase [Bacteroidales bacterium]|nr:hypoxanthine phosphoribosyltransferase [Bacteroidales bacterium]